MFSSQNWWKHNCLFVCVSLVFVFLFFLVRVQLGPMISFAGVWPQTKLNSRSDVGTVQEIKKSPKLDWNIWLISRRSVGLSFITNRSLPHGGAIGKVCQSPKSLGSLIWTPGTSAPKFIPMPPRVDEIFQSEPETMRPSSALTRLFSLVVSAPRYET